MKVVLLATVVATVWHFRAKQDPLPLRIAEIGHFHRRGAIPPEYPLQWSVQLNEQLASGTIERLRKQSGLLLRIYQAELAKDPTSRAAESSRSNMIALRHTIGQIYGEAGWA
jgi:hypothetical protein